jgi:hypothetical protein
VKWLEASETATDLPLPALEPAKPEAGAEALETAIGCEGES